MKTVCIELYSYNELSEDAKQKVKDNWQFDDFWGSERNNSQTEAQKLYDKFNELEGEIKGTRLYSFIQNHILNELKTPVKYTKSKEGTFNKYPSSKIYKDEKARFSRIQFDYEPINLTGYCNDYEFLEPIFDFLKNPSENISSTDLGNTDLDRIGQKCYEDDYTNFYEDESFAEHCEANNYTFEDNGNMRNF